MKERTPPVRAAIRFPGYDVEAELKKIELPKISEYLPKDVAAYFKGSTEKVIWSWEEIMLFEHESARASSMLKKPGIGASENYANSLIII